MKKTKKCACRYKGPIQIVSCAEHNAAAANLNKAQVIIFKLEIQIEKIRQAWAACRFGTFEDGPASHTPDRSGITVNFGDDKVTVHEGQLGRNAILKLGAAIRGD